MISRAKQLASITAAGVGAIALTGGKAEAAIIDSGILNTSIIFQSNTNPGNFAEGGSARFNSLAGGPSFAIRLFSAASSQGTYNRFAVQSMNTGGVFKNARVAAGKTWNTAVSNGTQYGRLGYRKWGKTSVSTTRGLPSVTDAYSLFRFTGLSGVEYGWLEFSTVVVDANSAAAADGPNITVIQYAFDNTGATIGAGEVPSPEPSSLAESGLAALILGAEGLRRWRSARKPI